MTINTWHTVCLLLRHRGTPEQTSMRATPGPIRCPVTLQPLLRACAQEEQGGHHHQPRGPVCDSKTIQVVEERPIEKEIMVCPPAPLASLLIH